MLEFIVVFAEGLNRHLMDIIENRHGSLTILEYNTILRDEGLLWYPDMTCYISGTGRCMDCHDDNHMCDLCWRDGLKCKNMHDWEYCEMCFQAISANMN